MALKTSNVYGDIVIFDNVVSKIVGTTALKCYGVSSLVSRRFTDSLLSIFGREAVNKGVKLVTNNNKIYVDVYINIKKGVNREAVIDSLKSSILYNLDTITGMLVKSVNVHVVGVS